MVGHNTWSRIFCQHEIAFYIFWFTLVLFCFFLLLFSVFFFYEKESIWSWVGRQLTSWRILERGKNMTKIYHIKKNLKYKNVASSIWLDFFCALQPYTNHFPPQDHHLFLYLKLLHITLVPDDYAFYSRSFILKFLILSNLFLYEI